MAAEAGHLRPGPVEALNLLRHGMRARLGRPLSQSVVVLAVLVSLMSGFLSASLANRLGFSAQSDPDKIERDLMARIPRERWFDFTYVLIDHGRAVCVAKRPRCEECVVSSLCPSSLV